MEKIAVISDIHGNLPAFETVLADIGQRGADQIVCLGDLAGKGPFNAEAVDLAQESCDVVIQGNWDVMLAREVKHPAMHFWQEQLGAGRQAYLRNLPYCYDIAFGGRQIRMYHASQESVFFRVLPWSDSEVHASLFTNSEATGLDRPVPDTILYGDIHAAYMLPFSRSNLIINVGSVGNPLDQTFATYVMLSSSGGSYPTMNSEFIRLPYDVERTIAHAEAINMPETEPLARELRTGIYRGASM